MIKSYKYVLIILVVLIVLLWYSKPYVHFEENESLKTYQLLTMGFMPLLFLGISVLFQKIMVSVINSDAAKSESEPISEEKIWKIAFFTNLLLGIFLFLGAIVCSLSKFKAVLVSTYGFSEDLAAILFILVIASFVIGTFIMIKNTVWEVNKLVGSLMIFISLLIFAFVVYLPVIHFFYLSRSGEAPANVSESEVVTDEMIEVPDEPDTKDYDFYAFNEMDFSDVETGGYFGKYYDGGTNENAKSQELLSLFLSKNLDLRDDQYISEIRRAIMYAQHEDEFSEINDIDEQMGRKPEEIRKAFDSYKPLIYAFLNEKIYFDSNLYLIVGALISAHDDIASSGNTEETMKKINTIMNMGYKESFPQEYYESLSPYFSERVLNPLKDNAKQFEGDYEYNYKMNAVWIYSFWGRRFEEKNHEEVFKILQEIQAHYFADR